MKRLDDARHIFTHGASNPSGVANSLLDAIREIRDEGGGNPEIATDAACRAMVYQLAHLFGMEPMAHGEGVSLALDAQCLANPF